MFFQWKKEEENRKIEPRQRMKKKRSLGYYHILYLLVTLIPLYESYINFHINVHINYETDNNFKNVKM